AGDREPEAARAACLRVRGRGPGGAGGGVRRPCRGEALRAHERREAGGQTGLDGRGEVHRGRRAGVQLRPGHPRHVPPRRRVLPDREPGRGLREPGEVPGEGVRVSAPGPVHPLLTGGAEYPFVKLERRRKETPPFIRDALRAALPAVSSYPATTGKPELRAACAAWMKRRYGVDVDA